MEETKVSETHEPAMKVAGVRKNNPRPHAEKTAEETEKDMEKIRDQTEKDIGSRSKQMYTVESAKEEMIKNKDCGKVLAATYQPAPKSNTPKNQKSSRPVNHINQPRKFNWAHT